MPVAHSRGSPVIYVAGSARELPAEVQDWLGRAHTRAVASPHLYDMLARLARGRKFAAILVNMSSVDWNEMEFFDHAARLARNTPIFVTGAHPHRAKLEAACRRGARLFEATALDEELTQFVGIGGSLQVDASSRRGTAQFTARELPQDPSDNRAGNGAASTPTWPRVRLADPLEGRALNPEDIESGGLEDPSTVPAFTQDVNLADVPAPTDAIAAPDLTRPENAAFSGGCETESAQDANEPADEEVAEDQDAAVTGVAGDPAMAESADSDDSQLPTGGELTGSEPVAGADAKDSPAAPLDGGGQARLEDSPIVFPWSSHPGRPRRTPPAPIEPPTEKPEVADTAPAPKLPSESPFKSVRLTPEEINALMGQPTRRQAPEGPV